MPAELAEVLAAPFTCWVAAVGTEMPKMSVAEGAFPSTWTKVGTSGALNYNDAGVTVTHSQTQQAFVSCGAVAPRKKWRTEEAMSVAFELVDLKPAQYALIMDSATVTTITGSPGEQRFKLKRGIKIHYYAMLLRGTSTLNEAHLAQYEISACCQSGNPAPKFSLKSGPAMLALQFDVLEIEEGKWAEFASQE